MDRPFIEKTYLKSTRKTIHERPLTEMNYVLQWKSREKGGSSSYNLFEILDRTNQNKQSKGSDRVDTSFDHVGKDAPVRPMSLSTDKATGIS